MKHLFIGFFIIVLVAAGYFFLKHAEEERELEIARVEEQQKIAEAEAQRKLELEAEKNYCFLYEQVATEKAPFAVEEGVLLSLKGNEVTGVKQGFQSGPGMSNGYGGTLTGTKDGDVVEVVFAYEIEGSQAKEKELYKFSETELQKFRYELVEEGDMLVPNVSSTPTILSYKAVSCGE